VFVRVRVGAEVAQVVQGLATPLVGRKGEEEDREDAVRRAQPQFFRGFDGVHRTSTSSSRSGGGGGDDFHLQRGIGLGCIQSPHVGRRWTDVVGPHDAVAMQLRHAAAVPPREALRFRSSRRGLPASHVRHDCKGRGRYAQHEESEEEHEAFSGR
jgi:hypothetical protein